MGRMESHAIFVKEQLASQEFLAKKYDASPYRAGRHLATAKKFRELLTELESIDKREIDAEPIARGSATAKRISLTLEDIEGLPEELIKELNITEADRQELIIENIIARQGGILSLDKIMVGLYQRTGEINKRNTLISRLYRMAQRGMIFNVPGKKGVYSTYEVSEADAKRLFGQGDIEPAETA
jgi:hypothetical protein